jgi:8-oxo-dGTP pyrophosphatase MutT (NUDIX family)
VILADFCLKIRNGNKGDGQDFALDRAGAAEIASFGKMICMNSQKHRWKPSVTVAALVERNGRFLVVEEETSTGLRFNQPAGHLDEGESLIAACAREALEETGCHVTPEALVGVYQWTVPAGDITYLRFAFACRLDQIEANPKLDDGIIAAHWLTLEALRASQTRHRSPLVLQCVEDWVSGRRLPLDSITHYD